MRRYFKISFLFLKLNLESSLVYRIDMLFWTIANFIFILPLFFSTKYIYDFIDSIGGYNYEQLMFLVVFAQLWFLLYTMIGRINFKHVATIINNGKFDLFLLKPVKVIRFVPYLQTKINHVPMICILTLFACFWFYQSDVSFWDFIFSFLCMVSSVIVFYQLTKIYTALNFWSGRNMAFYQIVLEASDITRIPVSFFPLVIKGFLLFIFPFGLVSNSAFEIIYNHNYNLLFISVGMSILLSLISEQVWRFGLKAYSSVN